LVILLIEVTLIDADCVNPQIAKILVVTKCSKSREKIRSNIFRV